MASEQDINIHLKTTANNSGIEKTEDGLKDVEEQAKQTEAAVTNATGATNPMALPESMMGTPRDEIAEQEEAQRKLTEAMDEGLVAAEKLREDQANLDVARAKAAQAARAQSVAEQAVEDSMQRVANGSRKMAMQLGALATAELAKGLASVNEPLSNMVSATAQGAAAGGPFGAIAAAALSAFAEVKKSWGEYQKIIKETEDKIRQNNAALADHAQKATQLRLSKSYEQDWKGITALIDGVNQAIRDNLELEEARRKATESMGSSLRGSAQEIITAQQATGALTAQQAQTQLAALKAQEAEEDRKAQIADAEARQKRLQADVEAARIELEGMAARREQMETDRAKAQAAFDALPDNAPAEQRGSAIGKLDAASAEAKVAEEEIKAAQAKLTTAQNAVVQGAQLLSVEIEKINQAVDTTALADQAKTLAEKAKEVGEKGAAAIEEAIRDVQPQSQLQADSLAALKAAVADGNLSIEEARAATQQLANMNGNLNTEFGKITTIVQTTQNDLSAIGRTLSNIISQQQTLSQQFQIFAAQTPQ